MKIRFRYCLGALFVAVMVGICSHVGAEIRPELSDTDREIFSQWNAWPRGQNSLSDSGVPLKIAVEDATPESMDALVAAFPQLQSVTLWTIKNPRDMPEIAKSLGKLKDLTKLGILPSSVLKDLAAILSQTPRLQELSLNLYDNIPAEGLEALGNLKSVRRLSLSMDESHDFLSGQVISQFSSLEYLHIDGQASGHTLRAIGKQQSLKILGLQLHHSCIADADLANLSRLHNLEQLYFGGRCRPPKKTGERPAETIPPQRFLSSEGMTDEGLALLSGLTQLKELGLGGSNAITDEGLSALRDLKQLERLSVTSKKLTGSGLRHLSGLTQLKFIGLLHSGFEPQNIHYLTQFPALEQINVGGTPVERNDGWKELAQLRVLKNLKQIDIELPFFYEDAAGRPIMGTERPYHWLQEQLPGVNIMGTD